MEEKEKKCVKVSAAGCCLPGPASRPSRDTCFLCLQQVGMVGLEFGIGCWNLMEWDGIGEFRLGLGQFQAPARQ